MINVRNVHNFLDSFSVYSTPMGHCLMSLLVVVFSLTLMPKKIIIFFKKHFKRKVSTVTLWTDDVLSFSKTNRNESFCNVTTFSLFSSKSMLLIAVFVVSAKRAGRLSTKSSAVVQTTASFVKSYSKICNRIKRWGYDSLRFDAATCYLKQEKNLTLKIQCRIWRNEIFTKKNSLLTKGFLKSVKLLKCHPGQ